MTKSNSVLFAGDLVPCSNVIEAFKKGRDFQDLRDYLQKYDFCFANLEAPITASTKPVKKAGPSLKVDQVGAEFVKSLGFTHVNLANNHLCDYGKVGFLDTLVNLDNIGLKYSGVKTEEKNCNPNICQLADFKLAVYNFCEEEFCTVDELSGATVINPVSNFRELTQSIDVDFKVVVLHAGTEHCAVPNPWLRDICKYYIECGADLVLCHHTHVASGFEEYQGKKIYYGLGNFLFHKSNPPKTWGEGYFVNVDISDTGLSSEMVPYRQMTGDSAFSLLEGERKNDFFNNISNINALVTNDFDYAAFWDNYFEKHRVDYLSTMLFQSRLSRGIFRKFNLRFKWSHEEKALLRLLNQTRCQSHSYVFDKVLQKHLFSSKS